MAGKPEVVVAGGDHVMPHMHVTETRPDGRSDAEYQAYVYRLRDGRLIEG